MRLSAALPIMCQEFEGRRQAHCITEVNIHETSTRVVRDRRFVGDVCGRMHPAACFRGGRETDNGGRIPRQTPGVLERASAGQPASGGRQNHCSGVVAGPGKRRSEGQSDGLGRPAVARSAGPSGGPGPGPRAGRIAGLDRRRGDGRADGHRQGCGPDPRADVRARAGRRANASLVGLGQSRPGGQGGACRSCRKPRPTMRNRCANGW